MIKAVIFDLDGTLLYTLDSIAKTTNYILAQCGLPALKTEQYKRIVGNGVYALLDGAFTLAGGNPAEIDEEVMKLFRVRFKQDRNYHVAPYDGITELIDTLKGFGLFIACNTNKPQENAELIIREYFSDSFDFVAGQRDGVPKKPDSAGVKSILKAFSLSEDETVYLGDSDVDMQTAKNSAVFAIGAAWGYRGEEELRENGADSIAKCPREVIDILKCKLS